MAMVTKPCPGDPATHPSTRTEVRIILTIAMPRAGDPITLHTTPTEVPARQSSTTAPYHTNRGPTHPTNHPPEVPARQSIALHRSRRGPLGRCDLCPYHQPPPVPSKAVYHWHFSSKEPERLAGVETTGGMYFCRTCRDGNGRGMLHASNNQERPNEFHPENPSTFHVATLLYPSQFCWFPAD